MTVPSRPARKPTVNDRIADWVTAFDAVYDHLQRTGPPSLTGAGMVLVAAETATELVKGVEHARE